jgi:RNA polymerase sigma-70 factor, ECF subfamily
MAQGSWGEAPGNNTGQEGKLIRGLRLGSAEAFSEFYERFAVGVHHFAEVRLGGDGSAAEEVVVQTLGEAARGIGAFDPRRATLAAWVYGIARRRVGQEIRRQHRRKSVPAALQVPLEAAEWQAGGVDMAERTLSRLEAKRKMALLAAELSGPEMEALTLFCIDQLSAREIGRIIGRSERAVHSLLHRAKEKARKKLGEDE